MPAASLVGEPPSFLRNADQRIAEMHPAYFAMSMATGVVSIACHLLRLGPLGNVLLAVNLVVYPSILACTVYRIAKHRGAGDRRPE